MRDRVPRNSKLHAAGLFCDRFYRDESGQDIIEYALLAAMVGLGSVSGTQDMASAIANQFTNISTAVASAIPSQSNGNGGGNNNGGNNSNNNNGGNGGGRRGRRGGGGGGFGGFRGGGRGRRGG